MSTRVTHGLLLLSCIGTTSLIIAQNLRPENDDARPVGMVRKEYQQDFIIPDLEKWAAVEVGMTEAELIDLLGQPIRKVGPRGEYKPRHHYPWIYGYTHKRSNVFPFDLDIAVHMCMGKVVRIEDGFGGVPVSTDGMPTIPRLLKPGGESVFDYYPRFVDMRWYPSSGEYPIAYEIEVQTLIPGGRWVGDTAVYEPIEIDGRKVMPKPFVRQSSVPHYAYRHSGMNLGRWRVRAKNASGVSDWSEYHTFEFLK